MVDNRRSVIRTPRGAVFGKEVGNALGRLEAVDIAVTYRVPVGDRELAVTALSLRPGGSVLPADLREAFVDLPVGVVPDLIHVVPEMTLNSSYRPVLAELRAAGVPESSANSWQFDVDSDAFVPFTPTAYAALAAEGTLS